MSNITAPTFDIAIIGGGFSGCMTLLQTMQQARHPLRIALFSRDHLARGAAYSTHDLHHLLNVPAHNMSAYPDTPDHFVAWLHAREATKHYAPTDFVPRRIYGEYLGELLNSALANTPHAVQIIEEEVLSLSDQLTVTTAQRSVSARAVVLATGNEAATPSVGAHSISPWQLLDRPLPANNSAVVILGAGLTGVDAFLTLRARGFTGNIYLASRSGRIPQPHLRDPQKYQWQVPLPERFSHLLNLFKQTARARGRWQEIIDSFRPHIQTMWRSQPAAARARFLNRYFGLWNIHRHRMAPQIWEQLQADSKLHIIATRRTTLPDAALTIRCIGQEYRTSTLRNPLLQQLLRDKLLQPHESGFGVKAQGFKVASQNIFAIGPLLIGELLETTAVPELRVQAKDIAAQLLLTIG